MSNKGPSDNSAIAAVRSYFQYLGLDGPTVAQAEQVIAALREAGMLKPNVTPADAAPDFVAGQSVPNITRLECERCFDSRQSLCRPGRCVDERCDGEMVYRTYVHEARLEAMKGDRDEWWARAQHTDPRPDSRALFVLGDAIDRVRTERGEARERVAELEAVLRFYADQGNYVPAGIAPTIWKDNGQRARAALDGDLPGDPPRSQEKLYD